MDHSDLILNKQYIVYSKSVQYKGTFIQLFWDHYTVFSDVIDQHNNRYKSLMFYQHEIFYDIENIKMQAIRARQRMEKRALDKVLKRLVNETFEW